jgi:RNA polymerase sigma-70 factor (ECF subfamily)
MQRDPLATSGEQLKSEPSDQECLRRLATGDAEVLGLLYDRYGRLVYAVALRITGDTGSAEEITQDVFLRLWQYADRYSAERGSPSSWLVTIAQRRAIDELRSRRGTSRRREVAMPESPPFDDGLDQSTLVQMRVDINEALADLPPAQREAIEMAYFGGLSSPEIARRTGQPLGTITTRLRAGLEKLRVVFRKGETEP